MALESAILHYLLNVRSTGITMAELIAETTVSIGGDPGSPAVERAVDRLVVAHLVRLQNGLVFPGDLPPKNWSRDSGIRRPGSVNAGAVLEAWRADPCEQWSYSIWHGGRGRRLFGEEGANMNGEERLEGGNLSRVARVEDTVRKPSAPWDIGVQALLAHLESVGFEGAPRALGADEQGRSIVSYIAGDTHSYPMPRYVWGDDTLVAMARLLRVYHDATVGFVAPADAGWQGSTPDGAVEVICHNDVAPYNVVFSDGSPIALIDFDMAAPGSRAWDLAYAAYRFVPLGVPSDEGPPDPPREQGRRLSLVLRSYGATFTARELLDTVVARLAALCAFMHERAAAGDVAFSRHIAEGDVEIYRRDAQYVSEQRGLLSVSGPGVA